MAYKSVFLYKNSGCKGTFLLSISMATQRNSFVKTFPFTRCSVVDVGSEWRTFNNEKSVSDPSRVGAAQVSKSVEKFALYAFVKLIVCSPYFLSFRQVEPRRFPSKASRWASNVTGAIFGDS